MPSIARGKGIGITRIPLVSTGGGSGPPPFSPPDLGPSKLMLWFDASATYKDKSNGSGGYTPVTADDDVAIRWRERYVGEEAINDTTILPGTTGPVHKVNILNSYPALRFSAATKTALLCVLASKYTGVTLHVFSVMNPAVQTAAVCRFISLRNSANASDVDNAGSAAMAYIGNVTPPIRAYRALADRGDEPEPYHTPGTPYLFEFHYDGTDSYTRRNGVAGAASACAINWNTDQICIGTGLVPDFIDHHTNHDQFDFIVCKDLTSPDIANVREFLRTKFLLY